MHTGQVMIDELDYMAGDQHRLGMEAGQTYYCDAGILTCIKAEAEKTTFRLSRSNEGEVKLEVTHLVQIPAYGEADFLEILRCAKTYDELLKMLGTLEFIN